MFRLLEIGRWLALVLAALLASPALAQTPTTTQLASLPNPSYPAYVELTATVTGGATSGLVNFYDGATLLGSDDLNGDDTAFLAVTTLTLGTHTLTAEYVGDSTYAASTSAPVTQEVVKMFSGVDIWSSTGGTPTVQGDPTIAGEPVTFSARVWQSSTTQEIDTPTGTVTFSIDGVDQTPVAIVVVTGRADFTTSGLTVGTHTIAVTYNGDDDYAPSAPKSLTHVVDAIATTTSVASSQNPSTAGDSLTFTATVSGGSTTPTGTVTFTIDGTDVATSVALVSGEATFTTSALTVGSHSVVVAYSGDATHSSSTSDPLSQVVGAIASSTSLSSSQNPGDAGEAVTFTANVSAATTPTGTVTFNIDGSDVGTVALNTGTATFTTSSLSVGSHPVVATYNGDATHATSTDTLTQTVNELGTVTIAVVTDGSDGTFGFTSATAALNLSVATAGGTGQSSAVSLAGGNYSISAASVAAAGFVLTDVTCDDIDSTGDAAAGTASIALAAGEDVTCTFSFVNSRETTTELIEDFFSTRAELILSHGPDLARRIDRLNGIVQSSADPASSLMGLMSIATSGGPRTLSGSLGAIEQAVSDRAAPAPFDVWFEGTFGVHSGNGGEGNFGIAYLGVDYLISPDFLVGALFQLDQVGFDADTGDASAEGTGWMIGPYVTGRLGDNLYFDLRAAAGRSVNSISPFGTYTDEVDATRWLIDASLSGQWSDGSWTFEPAVRLSYFEETSDAYTDGVGVYIPSVTAGKGQLALGPALSYRFVTDGEIEVLTGARLDGVLDFSLEGAGLAYDGVHAELEASIDLSLPGGTRLGASVKAGGLGEVDFRFLSGTVSVSAAIQ